MLTNLNTFCNLLTGKKYLTGQQCRLAVDMDIHVYIHVWISDLGHAVDISMDNMLAHLLNNLTTYMHSLSLFDFLPVSILTESLKKTECAYVGLE